MQLLEVLENSRTSYINLPSLLEERDYLLEYIKELKPYIAHTSECDGIECTCGANIKAFELSFLDN